MFFSGDPSTRKRVDLGGRSSKERDRQKLLEQTRLERNRRLWVRQQNAAALKIQVFLIRFCLLFFLIFFMFLVSVCLIVCCSWVCELTVGAIVSFSAGEMWYVARIV